MYVFLALPPWHAQADPRVLQVGFAAVAWKFFIYLILFFLALVSRRQAGACQ